MGFISLTEVHYFLKSADVDLRVLLDRAVSSVAICHGQCK